MPTLKHVYRKTIIFPVVIFLLLSLMVLAIDQHFNGISPTCAICMAKISWNGGEQPVAAAVLFFPVLAFYYLFECLKDGTISRAASLKNKAPPG